MKQFEEGKSENKNFVRSVSSEDTEDIEPSMSFMVAGIHTYHYVPLARDCTARMSR